MFPGAPQPCRVGKGLTSQFLAFSCQYKLKERFTGLDQVTREYISRNGSIRTHRNQKVSRDGTLGELVYLLLVTGCLLACYQFAAGEARVRGEQGACSQLAGKRGTVPGCWLVRFVCVLAVVWRGSDVVALLANLFWGPELAGWASDSFHRGFVSSQLKSHEHFHISVIMILMIQSGHNFAHVMTAWLSWHVQNCDLIET